MLQRSTLALFICLFVVMRTKWTRLLFFLSSLSNEMNAPLVYTHLYHLSPKERVPTARVIGLLPLFTYALKKKFKKKKMFRKMNVPHEVHCFEIKGKIRRKKIGEKKNWIFPGKKEYVL